MMLFDRATARIVLALAAFALAASPQASAAGYPDSSVRIVVPFGAGGVADTTARIVAEKLSDKLGQRFYVENQPGAGGIAAARAAISSPPDGYTLTLLTNGTAISVSLFQKLPFDPLKDFEPISSLGFFDFIFTTSATSPYKTIGDFIAAARAKPGSLNVGTINIGSTQNLSAELLKIGGRYRLHDRSPPGDTRDRVVAAARQYRADDRQLFDGERQYHRRQIPGAGIVGRDTFGKHA